MDLVGKIDKLMVDTTVVGDVAQNKSQGNVDVIGGECPEGTHYCQKRKKCIPDNNESVVTAAVVGSGQTRFWGRDFNFIDALETKEKVITKDDDKAKENLGRPDLRFDTLLGVYAPKTDADIDNTQMETDDE